MLHLRVKYNTVCFHAPLTKKTSSKAGFVLPISFGLRFRVHCKSNVNIHVISPIKHRIQVNQLPAVFIYWNKLSQKYVFYKTSEIRKKTSL